MGDLPNLPQGKGCIIPVIVLVCCALVLLGGLIGLGTALSQFPAFDN